MPKYNYRIISAKKFLKGTNGAKINIIFQTLCCYLRKGKNLMQTQGIAVSSAPGIASHAQNTP